MTTDEAILFLRRYSDFHNGRDKRPVSWAFPEGTNMGAAIDAVLFKLNTNQPIANCPICRHYNGYECGSEQYGRCKKFEEKE